MSLLTCTDYQLAQVVAVDEVSPWLSHPCCSPYLYDGWWNTQKQAQFFPDLVEFCRIAVDRDHKRVHVAGLDGDFRRQPFGKVIAGDTMWSCAAELTLFMGAISRSWT